MKGKIIVLLSALALMGCHYTNPDNGPIRLNQVGFAPNQEKTATITLSDEQLTVSDVFILNENGDTIWTGVTAETCSNPVSGKPCQLVDFSVLTEPGEYTLCAIHPSWSSPASAPFIITNRPYRELTRAALRAFYHQRASMATTLQRRQRSDQKERLSPLREVGTMPEITTNISSTADIRWACG